MVSAITLSQGSRSLRKEQNIKTKITAGWALSQHLHLLSQGSPNSHLPRTSFLMLGYIQNLLYSHLLNIFVKWIQYC